MNLEKAERNNSKVSNAHDRFTKILFIIYVIVLFWILLLKLGVLFSYMDNRSINVVPFNESEILDGENILNVLIFVPLGVYVGILFERSNFARNIFLCFLATFIVEGLQVILAVGAFDVTDIITNTLGGIIGLILFKVMEKIFKGRVKAQKTINVISAIGTILMILLLVLLKMDMLPIMYR